MDLKTKKMLCVMAGIISILTIVGTISYAYFTATANMVPVETTLTTGVARVRFADNDNGVMAGLNFGESITKKFTIENTGTVDANVKMYWDNLVNTYIEGSLTYTLSYSETEEGTYTQVVSKTNVPQSRNSSRKILANSLTIPVGQTYYYELTVTLNYLSDVNQDADLNAVFNTSFAVEDINYIAPNPANNMKNATQGIKVNFEKPATTDEGIYEMEDDYGVSYYYRGAVENNYVKFADFYWRIIRLNGDGSLRIIYDGTTPHTNGEVSNDRYVKVNQPFNVLYNDAKYAGWMYGPANAVAGTTTPSISKEEAQTNIVDSDIKIVVDEWYKTNIVDKGYGQYVSDTLFCNDRSTPTRVNSDDLNTNISTLGYGLNMTGFGAFDRLSGGRTNKPEPTFKCLQKNDAFTVSDVLKGNGALTYPVGLITADEIMTAGSAIYTSRANPTYHGNTDYYLYKSSNYIMWTLSPDVVNVPGCPYACMLYDADILSYAYAVTGGAVAPVINLTLGYVESMVGDGTVDNPYRAE